MNGKSSYSQSWENLPWKKLYRHAFDLQCKIYLSMRTGDAKATLKLQQLLIQESSTHYIATKHILEFSIDNKLASVDKTSFLHSFDRMAFADQLSTAIKNWGTPSFFNIIIENPNINLRLAFIEGIKDTIVQYIFKLSLEAAHEAIFSPNSYGNRSGRHFWDIQKGLTSIFRKTTKEVGKNLLKIDLNDFFVNISHNAVLDKIILPAKHKLGISKALHAGFLQKSGWKIKNSTITSLLFNVDFHGLEDLHLSKNLKLIPGFRYANLINYVIDLTDNAYELLENIKHFLLSFSLQWSQKTSTLFKAIEGFDF
jgi:RNA-directed DNA polymerase